jgi:hypothetical protein
LLGISGLASGIQKATDDTYLAGLWSSQIVLGLCWSVIGSNSSRYANPSRAPTWSWASLKGPCSIHSAYPNVYEPQIEVLECSTRPRGANLFGDVETGKIRVRGRMKRAQAWGVSNGNTMEKSFDVTSLFGADIDLENERRWYIQGGFAQANMDRLAEFEKERGLPVWVLPVMGYWPVVEGVKKGKKLTALILREVRDDIFERIGIVWRLSRSGSKPEWDESDEGGEESWIGTGSEMRDITIV